MRNDLLKLSTISGILVLISILLHTVSCQKQQDTLLIKGTVTSINEDISLHGVSVELYTREVESGIYSANYELFGEIITEADGGFAFNLPRKTWASVKLFFSKPGYFNWDYEIEGEVLKSDDGFDQVFSMDPKSWLRINIKNSNPINSGDSFEYRILNGTVICEECCTGGSQMFSGMGITESRLCQVVGQQEIIVQWNLFREGKNTGGKEKYFVPAGDTTIVNFTY